MKIFSCCFCASNERLSPREPRKYILISMNAPWKINYDVLKASFHSHRILTLRHGMSFSSRARARYHDISTAAPLRPQLRWWHTSGRLDCFGTWGDHNYSYWCVMPPEWTLKPDFTIVSVSIGAPYGNRLEYLNKIPYNHLPSFTLARSCLCFQEIFTAE